MGLAKKRAKDSVVTGEVKRLPAPEPIPETPKQETQTEQPEPLGTHNAPGNADARAAFLQDEGGAPIEPEATPENSEGTESIPQMSIEQICSIAVEVIDIGGTMVGNKVLKRPDVEWALETKEKATVEKALNPVMTELLADTKVTPMTLFIGVLFGCYAPRVMYMAATKPPNQQPPQPPPQPPQPENVAPPAQPEPVAPNANGQKTHGW